MTKEELLADLKQFIEMTISQQMSQFATKDDLKHEIKGVEPRLSNRIDTIDEKLDVIQDAIAGTVQDHEQRLRRLKQQTA